ncbi:MAG: class I SAM-dependent methyltransferase [Mycobacterium sp.]
MSIWSAGRYEAVAQRIAGIAEEVVAAVARRAPLLDSAVVDLASGTGSAALAAAERGARVTAVDITPELLAIGAEKAAAAGVTVSWVSADAADTGLPASSFDAAVSNMGVIFVEPAAQVAELTRLLKPGAVVGFSSWVRDTVNPLYDPIVSVLGAPPARGYTPDQWGDPAITAERLSASFGSLEFAPGRHPWRFPSQAQALTFVTQESPMHVDILGKLAPGQRSALVAAFDAALGDCVGDDGEVVFNASYVVVTAVRHGNADSS